MVLRVGSGHAFAGRLDDLHVAKRGGQFSQQVVQGTSAGVVGDGRAVAVEPGVAQPHDAGACHKVAGAEAEDEGRCAAGVAGPGPPDGVDPRVVRGLVGRDVSVAVDPEQGLADAGLEAEVRDGLVAEALADGDDQGPQWCGDVIWA